MGNVEKAGQPINTSAARGYCTPEIYNLPRLPLKDFASDWAWLTFLSVRLG